MRHLKAGRALGVKPAHRRAMMRNMVTSVLEHGRIRTTLARAKEVRIPLEKMITLGKQGDLSARRRAMAFVKGKVAIASLFGELAERYKERSGGYCRIVRLGTRRGDGAELALVILVGGENDPLAEDSKPRRRPAKAQPKAVLDAVADEVREGDAPQDAAAEGKGPSTKAATRATAPEEGDAPAASEDGQAAPAAEEDKRG